jgi:hypothetical protein
MGFPDYERDLRAATFDANRLLDRYFHSGQSAVFNGSPPEEEATFNRSIARSLFDTLDLRIHPLQIVVCGSAHLGFSPVPEKLGKPFDSRSSDIDVAIVVPDLFDTWWTELQSCQLVESSRRRVADELFWGFINPDTVKDCSKMGETWWELFGNLSTDRARGVRGKLYRTYWSMQNYHKRAIVKGRDKLLMKRTV